MKNITKKRGFTLIELLAVIVILAIIALIATPIVMNIIEDSKKGATERSTDNYIDAVETKVATSLLDPENKIDDGLYTINSDGNLCPSTNSNCTGIIPIAIEMSGTKPTSGKVVAGSGANATSIGINGYTVSYNTDSGKYEARKPEAGDNTTKVWTLTKAAENSNANVAEIGDLIRVGTENFYIISNDGTNIKALAQYNLNTTDGLQSESSANAVAFDDNSSEYSGSQIEVIVNEYQEKLNTEFNANIASASLLTQNELLNFNCDMTSHLCTPTQRWFITSDYWSGVSDGSSEVWIINNTGGCGPIDVSNNRDFGVRPVITISKSQI